MKKIITTMQFKTIVISFILLSSIVYSNDKSKENIFINEFNTILNYDYNKNIEEKEERENLAKSFVTNGSILQQQNEYAEAILEFQEALALDSTASICFAIAKSYKAIGFSISALRYCQMAIRLDPLFTPPYDLLINIFHNFGLMENAHIASKQLLSMDSSITNKYKYLNYAMSYDTTAAQNLLESMVRDSTETEAMWLLSTMYSRAGKSKEQITLLTKIIELGKFDYDVISELVNHYTQKNDLNKLFPLLDKADKSLNNDQIILLYADLGRGIILYEKGLKDTLFIRDFLNRFDEKFYFDYFAQAVAGNLASYIGDTLKTVKHITRAIFLDQDEVFPYNIASICYTNLKLDDSLRSVVDMAAEKFPDDFDVHKMVIQRYYYFKEYEEATIYCRKLYDLDSLNLYYISYLADLYQYEENFEESDKFYEMLLEIDPMNTLFSNNYAYSLSTRNQDLPKALRLSQYAIKMEPDNSAYLDTYGWLQYQMGNYEEALDYVLKSLEIYERSSIVFEHLGDIYIKLNKNDLALDAFKKSLNLDETSEKVLLKINELEK